MHLGGRKVFDWEEELWGWGMLWGWEGEALGLGGGSSGIGKRKLWGWEDDALGWEVGRRKLLGWEGEALRLISGVGRKEAVGLGGGSEDSKPKTQTQDSKP